MIDYRAELPAADRVRGRRGGSVFILVLIVMASLVGLSAGLGFRVRIEMRLAHAYGRKVQAHYFAMGGVERAKALLSEKELSASVVGAACHFNGTAKDEGVFEQFAREGMSGLEGSELGYCVRDELGYFNMNKSDPSVWEKLEGVSGELCGEIVDWTDADSDVSAGGAESDYYARLEPGYVAKNGEVLSVKELLYLRSVTARGYAGEDGDHDGVLDDNERDGYERWPWDNEDNVLDKGLVDFFTVFGDGKVNINTTSKDVLACLGGIGEGAAEIVVNWRLGADGQAGTDDDMWIEDAKGIGEIEGLTELEAELLGQYCCFGSGYFRVYSYSRFKDGFDCCLMATLVKGDGGVEVLCLDRLL